MNRPLSWAIDSRGGINAIAHKGEKGASASKISFAIQFGALPSENVAIPPFMPTVEAGARYSFELLVTEGGRFKVSREQAVLNSHDNRRVWFDRQYDVFHANVEPFHARTRGKRTHSEYPPL